MSLPAEAPVGASALDLRGLEPILRLLAGAEHLEAALRRLPASEDTRLHVSYDEAAQRLGIPEKWLRERIGKLPHRKMGKFVLFAESDLKAISEMFFVSPEEAITPRYGNSSTPLSALKPSSRSRARS
ncbi:helix-turn-helix domain-containing protein [Streptomyces sp. NPDC051561]|uniref:helix-turn-helix domain-containing protein n=1 Tax=Streptomyces sp. NPDC051561 TaxID=3365658 RepID=UPI0037B9393E